MEKELEKLFNELNRLAYEPEYHIYNVKEANQVIRRHFTKAFELRNSSLQLPSLKELNTEMKQLSEQLDTDSKQTEKNYFEAGFGYCHHIIDEKLNK